MTVVALVVAMVVGDSSSIGGAMVVGGSSSIGT